MTSIDTDNESNNLKPYLDALVSKRRLGFAWLDETLEVTQRFGELSQWIPIGKNICSVTPLFWGMESELLHLQDEPEQTITIPKVGLKTSWDDSTKLSIEISWAAKEQKYIVTLYNLSTQSDLDHELAKQVKARRIAEENYQNAKKQINEQQGLLELIMDHAPAAVAIFDHNMQCLFTTRNWLKLFALEGGPVLERSYYDMFPDRMQDKQFHESCLQGRHITLEMEKVRNGNGVMEWIRQDLQPWIKDNGNIGGIIIVADILTPLIEKRKELEQKNSDLSKANQELEQFTSIVSHDLKSPLRVIQSEIKQNAPQDVPAYVARIMKQSERMLSMLDDLFEYSHIARKSEVLQKINIREKVNEIIPTISNLNQFTIEQDNLDHVVDLPVAPFDLIIRNLIENAVTHHDQLTGIIKISMKALEEKLVFDITDDGPGIPLDKQEKIFQPFQTGQTTTENSGNGIGLALVKKMVELHQGSVEIISNPTQNRGSTFRITWPGEVKGPQST